MRFLKRDPRMFLSRSSPNAESASFLLFEQLRNSFSQILLRDLAEWRQGKLVNDLQAFRQFMLGDLLFQQICGELLQGQRLAIARDHIGAHALAENGIGFVRRYSGGPDIDAACGLLASRARGGQAHTPEPALS